MHPRKVPESYKERSSALDGWDAITNAASPVARRCKGVHASASVHSEVTHDHE